LNEFSFQIDKKDKLTKARAGLINTPNGVIKTPAFSPVGTKASVKTLTPEEIKEVGSQVILANTYHLYLQPGTKVIDKFGGFANFMGWKGPTITDSGGYQVSFLWDKGKSGKNGGILKITDKGALFLSHIDGSKHLLTPEKSIEVQNVLGADIIMAFDQPLGIDDSKKKIKEALKRTLLWEERSFKKWKMLEEKRKEGSFQALFGIVQGGESKKLRRESLEFILKMGFPGIAIGGETVGENPKKTGKALDTIVDILPSDKPVHALGLGGGPEGIFEAVKRGVDIFDNTSITRMARTGVLFIYPEDGGNRKNKFRTNIKKRKFKNKKNGLSGVCDCFSCKNFSASYLNHLYSSKELLGLRLGTIHNIFFINSLMTQIRKSIIKGDFESLEKLWLK
jgi:queuine tRNA-ribosyltransferase